jgi:uncharacterized repeat protein (TIGR01451 family)
MNRVITLSAVLVLAMAALGAAESPKDLKARIAAGRAILAPIELASPYVEVAAYENGLFTMGTVLGDPDNPLDDGKVLLYGHPNPGTGFTSLRVDGIDYPAYNFMVIPTYTQDGLCTTTWEVGGVRVVQKLRLVEGASTGRQDVLLMQYTMENITAVPVSVGVRAMLDTMLGYNDGAPFRVPGIGDVTSETELLGSSIPQYWVAFDNLAAPTIVSQGAFEGGDAVKPDRVVFAWWPTISTTLWDYDPISTRSLTSDSAVGIYWNPVELQPGESRTVGTYYGQSAVDLNFDPPVALGLTAPARLGTNHCDYDPNPFTVTAFLSNTLTTTTQDVEDLYAEIVLPDGLMLAPGSMAHHDFGTLPVGGEVQASWLVMASGSEARNLVYTVRVGSSNAGTKETTKSMELPQIPCADISIVKVAQQAQVHSGLPIFYTMTVTNNGPADATNVVVTDPLLSGVNFDSVTASQGSCAINGSDITCYLGGLGVGASATISLVLTPTHAQTVVNTAAVRADQEDPAPGNNSSSATTTVLPTSDLSVTKSGSPDPVVNGQPLTYTIVVTNSGPDPAPSPTLTDFLPDYVTFVSASHGLTESGGVVSGVLPALGAGQSVTVTIVVTPNDAELGAVITNAVGVVEEQYDPNQGNNVAVDETTVNEKCGIDLTGKWQSAQVSCTTGRKPKCTINGVFDVINRGVCSADANKFQIKFYLSQTTQFAGLPTAGTTMVGFLPGASTYTVNPSIKVKPGVNPSGMYLIAVVDASNRITEIKENNNIIVYGPLP